MGSTLNPIAPKKAKIIYNFGLSECNRVKANNLLLLQKSKKNRFFPLNVEPVLKFILQQVTEFVFLGKIMMEKCGSIYIRDIHCYA